MASNPSDLIYTAGEFLGWALRSGWQPNRLPVGVVYTFQAPVGRAIAEQTGRFEENTDLLDGAGAVPVDPR